MRATSEGRGNSRERNVDVWVVSGPRDRLQSCSGILCLPRVGGVNKTSDLENIPGLDISAFPSAQQPARRGSGICCRLAGEQHWCEHLTPLMEETTPKLCI